MALKATQKVPHYLGRRGDKALLGAIGQHTHVGQGDLIHKPAAGDQKARWGIIITADCDIAQDKAGSHLSYLNIVTMADYLENVWPAETLRKLRKKLLAEVMAICNNAVTGLNAGLNDLSARELLEWLIDSPKAEIAAALGLENKKKKAFVDALEKVELAFGINNQGVSALQKLRRIWAMQNTSEKEIKDRLTKALDYNQASDFHLIPEIPGSSPLGYVVLLRELQSIPASHIFASQLDLQISGNQDGYYIACHSTDNLRYAISQKMAFLFSRIGMSEDYESQCNTATQLAIEEIYLAK